MESNHEAKEQESQTRKQETLTVTNLAAVSVIGIFIPFVGILFALLAGAKAEKLLIKYPGDSDITRARFTALAGGILSVISLSVGIYLLLSANLI